MPDIFLSYSREDQARAKLFADAFKAQSLDVWWDTTLRAGEAYDQVTEKALREAKAVVVLWSKKSVDSRWVRAEATLADRNKTLIPCMIEPCERPIMFELTQTAELSHWRGEPTDKAWQAFLGDVRRFVGKEAAPLAAPTIAAPLALPSKPSIAVMPFANLSGDPDQEYFADGIMEEVVTCLSRFRSIFVIASGSTLSFKGKTVTPHEIGELLGVRYVLEGSVRKAGDRVRIAVRLTDANDGAQLWAERFEDTLEDVFALQDRVALAVAVVIEPAMLAAETRRASSRPTDDLGAYDLYLRSIALVRRFERPGQHQGIEMLERAVTLDPGFALGFAALALLHAHVSWGASREEQERHLDRARRLARHATELVDDDPQVLSLVADVLGVLGDTALAISLADRAVDLNPGSHIAWFESGWIRIQFGDADLGAERIGTSLRLDPLSADRPQKLSWLGVARFNQGRYTEALALLSESAHLRPSYLINPPVLAACYAHLGRLADAREALELYANLPASPVPKFAEWAFQNPEHRRHFMDGIALAQRAGGT